MRAAWYEKPGPAHEVLTVGEMPTPDPAEGEVLVRVAASGINPSDFKQRAGWRKEGLPYPRIVPHSDGSGVVEAVGDGVDASREGQRVWLYNTQRGRPWGTAAEYVTVPESQAVPLPDGIGFEIAACLGVPACTAHFAVLSDGAVAGRTILIAGAAGAVGHSAVQFAKWGGADVIATVSSDAKAEHARAAGADHIVNYRTEPVVERVLELTGGAGVDRIAEVDFGANLTIDVEIIKANGIIASYSSTRVPEPVLPYYPLAYKGVTVRFLQAYLLPPAARAQAMRDITETLKSGHLRPAIAARFPLEQIADAHALAESGTGIGNVVLEVAPKLGR